MAGKIFQRTDIRYLARALSDGMTHGGLDMFESGYDISTAGTGANKDTRSTAIIRHLWKLPDTDHHVIELLNELYVEGAGAEYRLESEAFRILVEKVLEPRGVTLGEDGYELPGGPASSATPESGTPTLVRHTESQAPEWSVKEAKDRAASHPTAANASPERAASQAPREGDRSKVFIVHGRDTRPVAVLRQFLHFVGLGVMSWGDAAKLANKSQPHTYDIVKAGIENAVAVIILFSPDEEARLKPDFATKGEEHETQVGGQARQNVTLEAGMAFALNQDKTIFVKSAPTRPISDIEGFNWVSLDGKWDSRNDLINRLRAAAAEAHPAHDNLMDPLAGGFKVV